MDKLKLTDIREVLIMKIIFALSFILHLGESLVHHEIRNYLMYESIYHRFYNVILLL